MVTPSGISNLWVFLGVVYFAHQGGGVLGIVDPCPLHRLVKVRRPRKVSVGGMLFQKLALQSTVQCCCHRDPLNKCQRWWEAPFQVQGHSSSLKIAVLSYLCLSTVSFSFPISFPQFL